MSPRRRARRPSPRRATPGRRSSTLTPTMEPVTKTARLATIIQFHALAASPKWTNPIPRARSRCPARRLPVPPSVRRAPWWEQHDAGHASEGEAPPLGTTSDAVQFAEHRLTPIDPARRGAVPTGGLQVRIHNREELSLRMWPLAVAGYKVPGEATPQRAGSVASRPATSGRQEMRAWTSHGEPHAQPGEVQGWAPNREPEHASTPEIARGRMGRRRGGRPRPCRDSHPPRPRVKDSLVLHEHPAVRHLHPRTRFRNVRTPPLTQ